MIYKITGLVDELKPTEVILDVAGVGYGLSIPLSTYERMVRGNIVTLFVHTYHREDVFRLFGFITPEERDIFVILLNISGIGPSMALSILSGISIGGLVAAVRGENPVILTKIPGIGAAKAEKLVFELKRKLKKLDACAGVPYQGNPHQRDAVEALVTLGFDETRSSRVVDELLKEDAALNLETVIKEALKVLSA